MRIYLTPSYNLAHHFVPVLPSGCGVVVPSEVVVLNSIVLPHKQITQKLKNEIIL